MKSKVQTIRLKSQQLISGDNISLIRNRLYRTLSVESAHVGLDFVGMDYLPEVQSPGSLQQVLAETAPVFENLPENSLEKEGDFYPFYNTISCASIPTSRKRD